MCPLTITCSTKKFVLVCLFWNSYLSLYRWTWCWTRNWIATSWPVWMDLSVLFTAKFGVAIFRKFDWQILSFWEFSHYWHRFFWHMTFRSWRCNIHSTAIDSVCWIKKTSCISMKILKIILINKIINRYVCYTCNLRGIFWKFCCHFFFRFVDLDEVLVLYCLQLVNVPLLISTFLVISWCPDLKSMENCYFLGSD